MKKKITSLAILVFGFQGMTAAQDSIYSAAGDVAMVSKYLWRGQRLTNDWSMQPAFTLGIGGFSANIWGTMDLTAVNPGDALPIQPGDGLKGKFSEVDYTFSYDHSLENATISVGTIFYTFPERSASLASTTEVYWGVSLDNAPLAPSFTLYVDVDETSNGGSTGLYFQMAAGHSFPTNHDVFTSFDLSATLAMVNTGFTDFYYGVSSGGLHDASLTATLPMTINDNWSAGFFVTYSGLIGQEIRDSQFQDPREPAKPTGADLADTLWGGFSLSVSF